MEQDKKAEGTKREANTKQKILDTAIELFAEKDYNSVSIREIAKAVGIKGSSIYNHFESKEEILDAILGHHMEVSNEVFQGFFEAPHINYQLASMSLEAILLSSMMVSFKFMEFPNMDKIFKILSKEQLNNDKIRNFFLTEYIVRPREEMQKIFQELVEKGLIKPYDPKHLAAEFHGYVMYKFYENYMLRRDQILDFEAMQEDFGKHIKFFCEAIKKAPKEELMD